MSVEHRCARDATAYGLALRRAELVRLEAHHAERTDRIRPDLSADAEGCLANDRFWNASGPG